MSDAERETDASFSIIVQRFYWQSETICLFLPDISQRAEEFQCRRHIPSHAMQYQMYRHIGGLTISSADFVNIIMVWNAKFGKEFQLLNIYDRNSQKCKLYLIDVYHDTG
jgi:hypothetical protein